MAEAERCAKRHHTVGRSCCLACTRRHGCEIPCRHHLKVLFRRRAKEREREEGKRCRAGKGATVWFCSSYWFRPVLQLCRQAGKMRQPLVGLERGISLKGR